MIPFKKKVLPSLSRHQYSRQKSGEDDYITKIRKTIQILSQKVNNLCSFQQKNMSPIVAITSSTAQRVQERFQKVYLSIIKLPSITNTVQRKYLIEKWLGKLCQQVFSTTFKLFETEKLNDRKTKSFCCQNMLSNIIKMIRQNNLTAEEISNIDKCLKNELIPYFLIKYPMSEEPEVNEEFNNRIVETDCLQSNQNDFVFRSKVQFNYRSDGNYNRQIMKLLNFIIQLPNMNIPQNGKSLFKNFYNDMQNFFKKVQVQQFTLQNNKPETKHILMRAATLQDRRMLIEEKTHKYSLEQEKQKEKYRENVKSYTKKLIGRKISQNIKPFSDIQIKDNDLVLRNPSLMRIVTKWCQQLMQNFDTYSQIINKQEQFRMKDGNKKIMKRKHLLILSELLKRQKKKVDEYLIKVNKNNSQCQFDFGSAQTPQKLKKFSQEQCSVGLFAAEVICNYQIYLVGYANTIIHALMSATKDYQEVVKAYEYNQDQFGEQIQKWRSGKINFQQLINRAYSYRLANVPVSYTSSVPQLITFRIGDILRCKCISNQKQIIALYHQLEFISRKQNTQMKIVRIKNRLAKGTKDILLNLMYKDTILIQMQLAISTNRSKFIDFSNKYNHVLYQLSRAQFGPLSEMCNIWINNDLKASFYIQQARNINSRQQKNQIIDHICCGQPIQFPFRCSQCSYFYNDCKYILKHIECSQKNCMKKICSLCRAEKFNYTQMSQQFQQMPHIQILGMKKDQNFISYRRRTTIQNDQSHQFLEGSQKFGMLIDLKGQSKKPIYYINVKNHIKNIILQIKDIKKLQFKVIKQINTNQQLRTFKKQYLVFSSPKLTQMLKIVELGDKLNRFMTEYNFPKLVKKWKQRQKSSIVYISGGLKDENIQKIKYDFSFTKKVNLYHNKLKDFNLFLQKFPNCEIIDFANNQVQTLVSQNQNLRKFYNVKVLYLNNNKLSSIDQEFVKRIKNIEQLQLANNKIQKLPQNFKEFTNIKILNLSKNLFQNLPQEITKLKTLRVLNLHTSKFYDKKLLNLPSSIGNLQNLKKLNLNFNKIKQFPKTIGQLSKLQILSATNNQLSKLPSDFTRLQGLKILNLSDNIFDILPQQIGSLKNLQILNLENSSSNQIQNKSIPESYCNLVNLKMMDISKNKITLLPKNIGHCVQIQTLFIYQNKFKQIPESIRNIKSLKLLYASNNQLQKLPDSICQLTNLQKLTLKQNKITNLPENIGNLRQLKFLYCQENNLNNLPKSFGNLLQLKQLFIQHNNITGLSEQFAKLKNLIKIDIDFEKLDFTSKRMVNQMKINSKN